MLEVPVTMTVAVPDGVPPAGGGGGGFKEVCEAPPPQDVHKAATRSRSAALKQNLRREARLNFDTNAEIRNRAKHTIATVQG